MKRNLGWFIRWLAFAVCPALAMFLSISHALAQSPSQNKSDSGDLILINGKIITVDQKDSIAQALAIHDGKIVAIGTNEEIRKIAAKDSRVIDLRGRTATPGLIDTHCHFDETERIYGLELSKITRVSEAVELVRQKTSSSKPGEWVTGSGWDEGKLTELRYITAADLDKVSPAIQSGSATPLVITESQTPTRFISAKFRGRPKTPKAASSIATLRASHRRTQRRSNGPGHLPNSSFQQRPTAHRRAENDGGLQ